ncbi:MAG: hypothetical protein HY726_04080 [Candidatus Rokubacteria bacterium]|nr:hypothetical protein [Candidatus Rokubacteria bacterium]
MSRLLLLGAVVLFVAGGPRLARLLGALLLAMDLVAPGARPALKAAAVSEVRIGSGVGSLYRAEGPGCAGLVLVHGLSRQGQAHPSFQRMARALARAGFLVLAPDFPRLRAFQLAESDVALVVDAVKLLGRETPGPLGILGFSFGAGPAVLAAADPGIRERVALVGSFGGYWDLRRVIIFIATGWYEEDGEWRRARPEEYNRWKLLAALTPHVADPEERRRLEYLAELKLADPGADVGAHTSRLGVEGRRFLQLVESRELEQVAALMDALPLATKERFRRLSPASRIGEVRARLLVAHGAADSSIPYTESVRLARAAPALGTLVVFGGLAHVFPSESGWARWLGRLEDGGRLVGLLDDLLALCRR